MELMEFSTLLVNTGGTDFTRAGMWEQMGIIAKFVMVLLLLMFLLSLALMIERSRAYARAKRQSIAYIMLLRNFLQERKLQEAVTAAGQHGDSPLAKVVGAGMGEYIKGMEALQEEGPEDVVEEPAEDPRRPGADLRPATPAARRKAEELGLDLYDVEGTGAEGRVLVRDVLKAADG